MKVLIITNMYPGPSHPNYGIFVKEQVDAVREVMPDAKIDVHFINGLERGKAAYLLSMFRISGIIKRGAYDIVHIHYGVSGLFLLNPFLRLKVPVVVTLHGGDILPEQNKYLQIAITKRIFRKADCVFCLNERMADIVKKSGVKRVEIVKCGVDTDLFTPTIRPQRNIGRPLKVIFPSSKKRWVKNYPLFQEVISQLRNSYGLQIQVVELDKMSREKVADEMRQSDMMLMTSIGEGSPQVVKEAMSVNLPIVSTNVGDVGDLLSGVCDCACGEPQELPRLVMEVLNGLHEGINGREKIFDMGLDRNSIAKKISDIYLSIYKERTK